MARRQNTDRNENGVSFWLDPVDYEALTRIAQAQGVTRKQIFVDLLHRRYRNSYPMLAALSQVVAASLAIQRCGASDQQIAKLGEQIDALALLALDEVRSKPESDV